MRDRRWTWAFVAGALALALALSGCSGQGSTDDGEDGGRQTVTLAFTALNSLHLWAVMARDERLMEPWGIDLDIVVLEGQGRVVPALLSGEVDVASSTPEQAFAAGQQQPDLRMILSTLVANPYVVAAAPGTTSIEQLRGQAIGVNAVNSSADYFAGKALLRDAGLTEGTDYTFINTGNTAQRVAALASGQTAATLLFPPDTAQATERGAQVIARAADSPSLVGAQTSSLVSLEPWFSENPDLVTRFVRGYQESVRWLQDPANRDRAVAHIAEQQQVTPELAAQTYDFFVQELPAQNPLGAIDPEELGKTFDNARAAGVDSVADLDRGELGRFYTNEFADAAPGLTR